MAGVAAIGELAGCSMNGQKRMLDIAEVTKFAAIEEGDQPKYLISRPPAGMRAITSPTR
jgi:hypothetical protein